MVPEEGYETCTSAMRNAKKLFTCDQPDQEKKYTLLFQEVNPNPFGLEFQRGQNYFLVCKWTTITEYFLNAFRNLRKFLEIFGQVSV